MARRRADCVTAQLTREVFDALTAWRDRDGVPKSSLIQILVREGLQRRGFIKPDPQQPTST
jgi:hypothetical protein